MPKVQWTCHYGYPGCASWEPCNACLNDSGLWRQISSGLKQVHHDHEYEQQEALAARLKESAADAIYNLAEAGVLGPFEDDRRLAPPKPTGIILEERMDGGCLAVSDTGHAMNLTAYQRTFWELRGPDDEEQGR